MEREIFKFRDVPIPGGMAPPNQEQRRSEGEDEREQCLRNEGDSQKFDDLKQVVRAHHRFEQSALRNPVFSLPLSPQLRQ